MSETSERADRLELIKRLEGNAAVAAAVEEIKAMKRDYEVNLGRTLLASAEPVDQREVDYKRGFFRGMLFAHTALIRQAGPKLDRLIDKELAERSDSE